MKVLITGSSGNIGSKIAEAARQSATCLGVDLVPGRFTTHLGDITDVKFMETVVQGVDAIIHAAAFLTPHVGVKSDDAFRRVNVHGTEVLLNLAIRRSVPRFVLTSTTSVYGCSTRSKTEAVWVTEALQPHPEDIYDITKLEAERLCREASMTGMNTVILRMSRCFLEPEYLMAFYRLYRGVSGRDVAAAHWLAATCDIAGTETFNISADSPFQPSDTASLLRNPWPVIERYYPGAEKLYDTLGWQKPVSIDRVYVIEKAQRLLHYAPRDNFGAFISPHSTGSAFSAPEPCC